MKARVIEYQIKEHDSGPEPDKDPRLQRALLVSYNNEETIVVPFYEETYFHALMGEKPDGTLEYFNRSPHNILPRNRKDYKIVSEVDISESVARTATKAPEWMLALHFARVLVRNLLNVP